MTGVEALQALRDGKKVTNSTLKGDYFARVFTPEKDGAPYTTIAWVPSHEEHENWVQSWCGGDPFDGSDFLEDDWEVVE
jgi:hypothetical protein